MIFPTKVRSITATLCLGTCLTMSEGKAVEPAPAVHAAPSPAPAFPSGFTAFTPNTSSAAPSGGAPAIAEWTRSAAPGDTVVLTGSAFSAHGSPGVGRDTRFWVYGQSGAQSTKVEANIHRLADDQAAVTLPSSLPTNSVYLIWPENQQGTGRPAVLNRTEAWWAGPDELTPGQAFSVYGRNLGSGTSSWVYLQNTSGSGQWLTAQSSNGFKSNFTLPTGLAAGNYKLWAHNGLGAQYGWARALDVNVSAGFTWTSTQFNVKNFGAVGDGIANDSPAISAALAQARNSPGSSVLFPAGTYLMATTVGGWQGNMRWVGAGKNLTKVIAKAPFTDDYGLFVGSFTNVHISDMTFDTGGDMGGVLGNSLFQIRTSENVHFTNVRFTQQLDPATDRSSPVDFQSSEHIYFSNCEFILSNGVFSGNARQVYFDQCAFRGVNDANAMLYIWGGSQVSVTNSTATDFNTGDIRPEGNGWAQGRWISGRGGGEGAPRELYFAGNTTTNLMVRPGYGNQNTGEQFMFEGLDSVSRGLASSGTSNSITVTSSNAVNGMVVTIVGGKGVGQSRKITNASGGTLTVDEPWSVIPDNTSLVSIGGYLTHVAVIGNNFDGKAAAVTSTEHTATTGVQPYGGAANIVVANNTFQDLRQGISNWSHSNAAGGGQVLQPNFFNDFAGNTFTNCRIAIQNNVSHWESSSVTQDTAMLGNTTRHNQINATEDAFGFWSIGINGSSPTIAMNLYQGNTVSAKRVWASDQYPGMQNQILVANQMTSSGTPGAALNISQKPALRENTWTPAASAYSGTPTGILEMPKRVVALGTASGTAVPGAFTVWNSGTGALSWSASTTTPWLNLTTTSGNIADERSSNPLNFTVNTTVLSSGDHTGIITVSGAGGSQQVTVTLTVDSAAPQPGSGTGLKGDYFSGMNFNTLIKSQTDPQINFNWASGSPKNLNGTTMSSVGPESFSVRWTGQIQAMEAGTYTFTITTDDGGRLWIGDTNGTPLINKWINQAATSWSGNVTLTAGQKYNIKMEYFEDTGLAEARLSWLRPGTASAQIVPQSQLFPTMGTSGGSGTITREVWTNHDGNDVIGIPLHLTPNIVDTLTSMEAPTDWADKYGTRLRGFVHPPTSGSYTFWIAGDDSTELWLSTNDTSANKVKIAFNPGWTASREWNKYTSQKSAAISLTAGQKYYIEALQKEGGGGDNLAVGWLKPGQSGTVPSEVVPGSALSPWP